jgi:hypothetical protein
MGPFRYAEIEAGIIDADEYVGTKRSDIVFTKAKITKDSRQILDDLCKAHEGQFTIMFYQGGAGCLHLIASPAANDGLLVLLAQGGYQIASMKIAGGLARYDIIAHGLIE